jgi:hypothetical protein
MTTTVSHESLVRLLRKDLEQSYVCHHEWHMSVGPLIEFEDCSLWVCKNRREKLAEWDVSIAEAGIEQK